MWLLSAVERLLRVGGGSRGSLPSRLSDWSAKLELGLGELALGQSEKTFILTFNVDGSFRPRTLNLTQMTKCLPWNPNNARTRLRGRSGTQSIARVCQFIIKQAQTIPRPPQATHLSAFQMPQLDRTHYRMLMTILAPEMPLTCVSK